MVFKKKIKEEPEEPDQPEVKEEPPFNPPKLVKTDAHCTVEGCEELKAPGQTYVCAKHVRSN